MIMHPGLGKGENTECKLKKLFYNLKQSLGTQFDIFAKVMKK